MSLKTFLDCFRLDQNSSWFNHAFLSSLKTFKSFKIPLRSSETCLKLCKTLLDLFKTLYDSCRLIYDFRDSFTFVYDSLKVFKILKQIRVKLCKILPIMKRFWFQQYFSLGGAITPCFLVSSRLSKDPLRWNYNIVIEIHDLGSRFQFLLGWMNSGRRNRSTSLFNDESVLN